MEQKSWDYYAFALLTGLGFVFLLVVAKESVEAIRDRMLGDETPQQITASDLIANGAGANRHVLMTNVAVGQDFLMRSGVAEKKHETYLVVSPAGTVPGTPGKTLLVHVTRFQGYAEARQNPQQQAFTGFFTSNGEIPPAQKKLLGVNYPNLALDRIPYLDVRDYKGTSGFRRAALFAVMGVPLLVIGIIELRFSDRQSKSPVVPPPEKHIRRAKRRDGEESLDLS